MATFEEQCTSAISSGRIHGAVLAARNRSEGQYATAMGQRTLVDGSKVKLQPHDLVFVASCTKLITTIAALQCCERGLLSLDADLRPRLPALAAMGVLASNTTSKEPTIEPLQKPLTLRHLLTHSSGLAYAMHPSIEKWREANPFTKATGKVVSECCLQPLLFQPGDGWEYSVGLDWAGVLVEECSGIRLDAYIRGYILSPLGIPPADFTFFPVAEGLSDRMADLNPDDPNGYGLAVVMGRNIHEPESTACFGGSGGYSTAEALVTILNSIMLNDGRLLTPASVAEMHKPQLEPLALEAFNTDQTSILPVDDATGTRTARDHSLGGILVKAENDPSALSKGSITWGGGINSAWVIDPVKGICGFVSPQLKVPGDFQLATDLRNTFTKELMSFL